MFRDCVVTSSLILLHRPALTLGSIFPLSGKLCPALRRYSVCVTDYFTVTVGVSGPNI